MLKTCALASTRYCNVLPRSSQNSALIGDKYTCMFHAIGNMPFEEKPLPPRSLPIANPSSTKNNTESLLCLRREGIILYGCRWLEPLEKLQYFFKNKLNTYECKFTTLKKCFLHIHACQESICIPASLQPLNLR